MIEVLYSLQINALCLFFGIMAVAFEVVSVVLQFTMRGHLTDNTFVNAFCTLFKVIALLFFALFIVFGLVIV